MTNPISSFLRRSKYGEEVIVVSGLPRSGTSMIMQMLETAGLPLLTDGVRPPDADNPRGYYEFEPVKAIKTDASFLEVAVGRVVKVVAPLLPSLPPLYDYRIVFVERALCEVLASQRAMLAQRGQAAGIAEGGALAKAFSKSASLRLRGTPSQASSPPGPRLESSPVA